MKLLKTLPLLILLTVFNACSNDTTTPKQEKKHSASPVLVEAATATEQSIARQWERTGTLVYRQLLRVYTQEEGRITHFPWFEGDKIKKGDILVQLDNELLKKELKKAQATESMAARRVERLERLQKTRAASEEDLVEAQTALRLARVELEILNTRLSYTTIKAPFSGIVTRRLVEPGDVVSKNTQLLTIAAPESLVARVSAPPALLDSIDFNSKIEIYFDTSPANILKGKLQRVFPTLSPQSRLGTVEIGLNTIPTYARAGQRVRISISGEQKLRLLIPAIALRTDRKSEYVYLINNNNQIERKDVVSGMRINDQIEIITGLNAGMQIVQRGFMNIKNREFVTVLNKE